MAIRNVITGGVGLNTDVIGWVVTGGFGDLSAAVVATVVTGKYAPEHAAALAALGEVRSFAADHAGAFRDIAAAGSG